MFEIELYKYFIVVLAGVAAGFINVFAGSGSLITLPALMFLGLPANIANGTNRIAILLQNIVAVSSLHKSKQLDYKQGIGFSLPVILGTIPGAFLAVNINEEMMEKSIGALLIIMFFLIVFNPSVWIKGKADKVKSKPTIIQIVILFFIGVYGGFIQIGTGLFLLAGLVLGAGLNIVKANALKLFIILIYSPVTIAIFFINGQVNIIFGLVLAIGTMLGAFVATKVAVNKGAVFARYILLSVVFIASLKFIGVFSFIKGLF